MTNTFTDRDLRQQVIESLAGDEAEYNIPAIVDAIQREYGTVDTGTIECEDYWRIVVEHSLSL